MFFIGIIWMAIFTSIGNYDRSIGSTMIGIFVMAGGWLIFCILMYVTGKIKIDKKILFYNSGLSLEKRIDIDKIINIYRTPKLKPFDKILEGLSIVYQKADQQKRLEINLNLFKPDDIGEMIREFLRINPAIKIDEYSESLIRGEYQIKEQANLIAYKQKLKSDWNPKRLLKTASITLVIGVILIAMFLIYVINTPK